MPTRPLFDPAPDDWQTGPAGAPALIAYCDFQCEDCRQLFEAVAPLRESGEIRYIYRNLPLTDVHEWALALARGAEAAGKLGRFWEMHDALYNAPLPVREGLAAECAAAIGLDAADFAREAASEASYRAVRQDVDGIRRLGLTATPTLIVNGEHYAGLVETGALRAALGVK